MSNYLLAAGVFAGVCFFLLYITNLVKHLDTVEHFERVENVRNGLPIISKKQRLIKFFIQKTSQIVGPKKYETTKRKLICADMEEISPEQIIFLSFAAAILMAFVGFSAGNNFFGSAMGGVLLACLSAFLGFNVIDIFITRRVDARNAKLQAGVLPVVELFAIAVESGLNIQKAIETVSETFDSELTGEFRRFINDTKKFDQKTAFENLLVRCGHIDDIRLLIESLQQSIQTGSKMLYTLNDQVVRIRTSVKLKATTDSQKLALKMIFPSIIFQLPAFILILFIPAIINMYESFKTL